MRTPEPSVLRNASRRRVYPLKWHSGKLMVTVGSVGLSEFRTKTQPSCSETKHIVMILCPEIQSPATKKNRSDEEILLAVRLERRLQSVILRQVRVHICGHELQLFGIACSWHAKQLAQETARLLAPAYRIRNELRVD